MSVFFMFKCYGYFSLIKFYLIDFDFCVEMLAAVVCYNWTFVANV